MGAGPATDRIAALDHIRGLSILGILMVNAIGFAMPMAVYANPGLSPIPLSTADLTTWAWIEIFFRDKFITLFSLLFGISFAVQLDSSTRRGAPFRLRFSRRLAALFVIGAAHAAIWYGDILKDYAVLGLALLLAARWPVRQIAAAAALLLAARLAWPVVVYSVSLAIGHSQGGAAPEQAFTDGVMGLAQGMGAFFRQNLQLVSLKAQQMVYEGRFITILSMFFVGAWVGKVGLYRDLSRHRQLLIRAWIICGPVGLCAEAASLPFHDAINAFPPTWDWVVVQSLTAIAAPALSLAYASAFALAWLALGGRFLRRLAPVGRTALTSYVSQTLVCTAAFVWLGLGRGLGAIDCLMVALLLFTAQCMLAQAWLQRFRFGPLEWIWRCATYGQIIGIRRATP